MGGISSPSLRGLAAVALALLLAVGAGIAAAAAGAGGLVGRPVSADALPVYPHLALPHGAHVQGQRIVAGRRIEESLEPNAKNAHSL